MPKIAVTTPASGTVATPGRVSTVKMPKVLMPKVKCCVTKPRCKRCPLRMLADGTLPEGYRVKKRRLVDEAGTPVKKADKSKQVKKSKRVKKSKKSKKSRLPAAA